MNILPAVIFEASALVVLMVLSAFFSSAETVMFSLNPVQLQRIRKLHPIAGGRVADLLGQSNKLLSTILVGNTIVNITAAGVGYALADLLAPRHSEVISIVAMTAILLVFGEVAPKRLAINYAERLCLVYGGIIAPLVTLLAPLRILLEKATVLTREELRPRSRALTDDELITAVEVGEEQGVFDAEDRSMVSGILRLSDADACDVMTPRVDLIGIDLDKPPNDQLEIARNAGFRHVPVYHDSIDAIEGFLNIPRFLLDPEHNLPAAIEPALFVPETVALDDLLITFQREQKRIACVLDEYGGTAGIITRGDILEIVTDDVDDDSRPEPPELQPLDDNRWLIEGTTSLDEINHLLDLHLEAEGADRISGWVIAQAGEFLKPGASVSAQGCRVEVRKVRRHRIEQVVLSIDPPRNLEPEDADERFMEDA